MVCVILHVYQVIGHVILFLTIVIVDDYHVQNLQIDICLNLYLLLDFHLNLPGLGDARVSILEWF